MPEPKPADNNILWHQSGINQDGEPFVQLLRGMKIICQMDPEQARDHARAITEAAEAAEQDAFLYDWVLGKDQAMGFIIDFRKYRAERTGKSQGPTRPTDWIMPEPEEPWK